MKRIVYRAAVLAILINSALAAALTYMSARYPDAPAPGVTLALHIALLTLTAFISASILLAYFFRKIINPINNITLDNPESHKELDEIAPIIRKLRAQQISLDNANENLRRRAEEFSQITSGMSEGLIILSADMRVVSCNASALRFLDSPLTLGVAAGRHILEINRSAAVREALSQITPAKPTLETFFTGNGRGLLLRVSAACARGKIDGMVIFITDVTERREREELRRTFTANVSHELKTPLASILGYAELIKNGMAKPRDESGFGGRIYEEAQRMTNMIDDLLLLSRLDEAAPMPKQDVDLLSLALAEAETARPHAAEAGVIIEVECSSNASSEGPPESSPVIICGVPSILAAMLHNLIDNAVKYNVKGGRVRVIARQSPQGAVLIVEDTGIGIPPLERERIFERFYRIDRHGKSRSPVAGTGLGLSIVKHAAMLHNASISITGIPGAGTRVTVTFPA